MASYVQSNLINGEEIKYLAKVSKWSLFPKLFFGVILLPACGVGLIFIVSAAITYYSTELAITNKRVIAKFGLIRRDTIEINIPKIESIRVKQGFWGRIFGFGSVLVAGSGNPQAPIPGISAPIKFRNRFFEIQEQQ